MQREEWLSSDPRSDVRESQGPVCIVRISPAAKAEPHRGSRGTAHVLQVCLFKGQLLKNKQKGGKAPSRKSQLLFVFGTAGLTRFIARLPTPVTGFLRCKSAEQLKSCQVNCLEPSALSSKARPRRAVHLSWNRPRRSKPTKVAWAMTAVNEHLGARKRMARIERVAMP